MKKYLMCLALALVAALAVTSFADVTTSAAGNPINVSQIIPSPAATMNCADVSISTFGATQVLAARTSAIRTALYVINASTIAMSSGTRPPDVSWSGASAPTIVAPSAFAQMPGVLLHPAANPTGQTTQSVNGAHFSTKDGSGVYSGAIYAVAESTGATVDVKAFVTACEFY